MKAFCLFTLITLVFITFLMPADQPDFIITEIIAKPNQFIYLKLMNRSNISVKISQEQKEKIFIVIYINQIKRTEYKLKYIDAKLFQKNSTILMRTNFRFTTPIRMKIEINKARLIPESNYKNNALVKHLE